MYRKYLKQLILFLFLLALPICGNWFFLFNSGELLPIESIVEQQTSANGNCIVGLATRNQGYYYKKALYQKIKPQILVLGSSRVMQFRRSFFTKSMINAGGAMNSVNEGLSFLKEALADTTPEIVIIGLDYWWFNENALEPSLEVKPPPKLSHAISLRSYLLPYKWLWQKKVTLKDYFARMNPLYSFFDESSAGIGVDGIFNQNGFASDGSYVYTKTITGKEKNIDDRFELSINNISHNGPRFEYGSQVNPIHFNHFVEMLKLLEQKRVKVFLFIAPLAPKIANKMDEYKNEYAFIAALREELNKAGIVFADFHHPNLLAATDCEFIDGIHGGDLVYAKILKYLAKQNETLGSYLDHTYLDGVINHYHDIAMIPEGENDLVEIDFLHLGCDKSTQFVKIETKLVERISS